MHQQRRISPQQPALDRLTYRFKPSFLAILSLDAAIVTCTVFVVEIINPAKLSTTPIQNLPILITFVLFLIIALSFLAAYLTLKLIANITICPAGINGRNSLSCSIYVDWQDISSVKTCYLFRIRYLSIRSIVNKKRSIGIDSLAYNIPKILDRVREYAGDDHPLTIALEKEISLPRQNPAKMLWRIIIGIVIILSIWLIGGNLYADYREKPLNEAIANYVHQHPKTPPNQAAIDLQAAMAKLGISVGGFGDGSKALVEPDKLAAQEWKTIEPILDEYVIKQIPGKTENLLLPSSGKLPEYLKSHQAQITSIQNRLASGNLPNWGNDSGWIEGRNPKIEDGLYIKNPYYFGVLRLSRLLIANIIEQQQPSNRDILQKSEIVKNLSRSLQQQTTLIEQEIALTSEKEINRLFWHLPLASVAWQESLPGRERSELMRVATEHDLLSEVRVIQEPRALERGIAIFGNKYKLPFTFILRYYNLLRPYK
jgi:hypothetical protein